jgi:hypothetical protein
MKLAAQFKNLKLWQVQRIGGSSKNKSNIFQTLFN